MSSILLMKRGKHGERSTSMGKGSSGPFFVLAMLTGIAPLG